jgi:hypothetical protein
MVSNREPRTANPEASTTKGTKDTKSSLGLQTRTVVRRGAVATAPYKGGSCHSRQPRTVNGEPRTPLGITAMAPFVGFVRIAQAVWVATARPERPVNLRALRVQGSSGLP